MATLGTFAAASLAPEKVVFVFMCFSEVFKDSLQCMKEDCEGELLHDQQMRRTPSDQAARVNQKQFHNSARAREDNY